MDSQAVRLIISSSISVINFVILCISQAAAKREDYLKIQCFSMGLMVLEYVVMGLWISVFSNIATIIRNIYNARARKPKLVINIVICLITVVLCIVGSGGIKKLTWIAVLPLISLLFYSIAIMTVKSRTGMAIVDSIDALLWISYDFNNFLIMNVITDSFNILMGILHALLPALDKKYMFTRKKRFLRESEAVSSGDKT